MKGFFENLWNVIKYPFVALFNFLFGGGQDEIYFQEVALSACDILDQMLIVDNLDVCQQDEFSLAFKRDPHAISSAIAHSIVRISALARMNDIECDQSKMLRWYYDEALKIGVSIDKNQIQEELNKYFIKDEPDTQVTDCNYDESLQDKIASAAAGVFTQWSRNII